MNDAVRIMQKWRRAKLVKEEYCSLVADGYLTVGIASRRMGISEEEFKNLMAEWKAQEGEDNGSK